MGVTIDGFIVKDAYNDLSDQEGFAAGVHVIDSVLELRRCTIMNNHATGGAALYNRTSNVHVLKTRIVRNDNGAVINSLASVTFEHCDFLRNWKYSGNGAAVASTEGSIVTYENCYFRGNKHARNGGACFERGTSHFVNCLFVKNRAGNVCGALMVWGGDMTVEGCIFYRNRAEIG